MQDITFVWKEKEYRVEAREVLPLIAKVEEVLTLGELAGSAQRGKLQLAKLSMAFGTALRYAGAVVTNDEVYEGMFKEGDTRAAVAAMNTLLSLMVPPEHLQEKGDGKKKAAAAGGSLSRKPTRPPLP